MQTPGNNPLTRRDLLKYGAAGSAVTLLGSLVAAPASAAPRSALRAAGRALANAAAPKRGGTLRFARSIAPTTLDPANTIIAGDIYTLDKIFEPLFVTNPAGQLRPMAGFELHGQCRPQDVYLRPASRRQVLKRQAAGRRRRRLLDKPRRAPIRPAHCPSSTSPSPASTPKGTNTVVFNLSQPWAPFLSDISVFANAILPANFGGQSEKAFFNNPVGTGPFTVSALHAGRQLAHLEAQPHLLAGGQALPRLGRVPLRRQRQPASAAGRRAVRST